MKLILWLKRVFSKHIDQMDEELSYGVGGEERLSILSFAQIFALWCHPMTDKSKVEMRLRETRQNLLLLVDIGSIVGYYNTAPCQELRQLILERLPQLLVEEYKITRLASVLRQIKNESPISGLVKWRITELKSIK